jgi:hypothetical protein
MPNTIQNVFRVSRGKRLFSGYVEKKKRHDSREKVSRNTKSYTRPCSGAEPFTKMQGSPIAFRFPCFGTKRECPRIFWNLLRTFASLAMSCINIEKKKKKMFQRFLMSPSSKPMSTLKCWFSVQHWHADCPPFATHSFALTASNLT